MISLAERPILCSLFATFLWGAWAVGAKFSADRIGFFNSSLIYVLFSFLTVLTAYIISGTGSAKPFASGTLIAMVSGIAGGLALLCFQAAIQNGNVSTVVPITGLYPLIPAIYGIVILTEEITITKIAGIVMAVAAGILLSV